MELRQRFFKVACACILLISVQPALAEVDIHEEPEDHLDEPYTDLGDADDIPTDEQDNQLAFAVIEELETEDRFEVCKIKNNDPDLERYSFIDYDGNLPSSGNYYVDAVLYPVRATYYRKRTDCNKLPGESNEEAFLRITSASANPTPPSNFEHLEFVNTTVGGYELPELELVRELNCSEILEAFGETLDAHIDAMSFIHDIALGYHYERMNWLGENNASAASEALTLYSFWKLRELLFPAERPGLGYIQSVAASITSNSCSDDIVSRYQGMLLGFYQEVLSILLSGDFVGQ